MSLYSEDEDEEMTIDRKIDAYLESLIDDDDTPIAPGWDVYSEYAKFDDPDDVEV